MQGLIYIERSQLQMGRKIWIIPGLSKWIDSRTIWEYCGLLEFCGSSKAFKSLRRKSDEIPTCIQCVNRLDSRFCFTLQRHSISRSNHYWNGNTELFWAFCRLHKVPNTAKRWNDPGYFSGHWLARLFRKFQQLVCCSSRIFFNMGVAGFVYCA